MTPTTSTDPKHRPQRTPTRHHYADRPCPNCGAPLDVTPGTRDDAECVPCTWEHVDTRRPADD